MTASEFGAKTTLKYGELTELSRPTFSLFPSVSSVSPCLRGGCSIPMTAMTRDVGDPGDLHRLGRLTWLDR